MLFCDGRCRWCPLLSSVDLGKGLYVLLLEFIIIRLLFIRIQNYYTYVAGMGVWHMAFD